MYCTIQFNHSLSLYSLKQSCGGKKKKDIVILIIQRKMIRHKEVEWFSQSWRNQDLNPMSLAPGYPLFSKTHTDCTYHRTTPTSLTDFRG